MKLIMAVLALLVLGATASGQTYSWNDAVYITSTPQTINSDGVSVRNSAPANVIFQFPLGASNVVSIQMACSDSAVNHNWVFVYEEEPNGFITTYPFHVDSINCSETIGSGGTSYSATLENPITVTTPDHTITIDSAAWTAVRASSRSGYYWKASGGSATITVD